jgi:CheY-like chemotaxis protein
MSGKRIEKLIGRLTMLVVDDNMYTRKLLRMMLMNLGAKTVYEASDGVAALDIIRTVHPDVMILDWVMPVLNGPQVVRIVRSPDVFPNPDLPIIMLTAHGQRSHVQEAIRLGVNEFLVKPVSPKALQDRLLSILVKPRPMMQIGKYYIPKPRALGTTQTPELEPEPEPAAAAV